MEHYETVKAQSDYFDDVHLRRRENATSTLCGLKTVGPHVPAEASCLRCRQFAAGDF